MRIEKKLFCAVEDPTSYQYITAPVPSDQNRWFEVVLECDGLVDDDRVASLSLLGSDKSESASKSGAFYRTSVRGNSLTSDFDDSVS